jgi:hypothetical protein
MASFVIPIVIVGYVLLPEPAPQIASYIKINGFQLGKSPLGTHPWIVDFYYSNAGTSSSNTDRLMR